jgi:hypothetical protein
MTLHATRHTFITLARRGGARAEVVEQISHNARGTIVDHYTHWDWEPLCEAVLALQLPRSLAPQPADQATDVAALVAKMLPRPPKGLLFPMKVVEAPGIEP